MTRRTRGNQMEILRIRHNVAHKPIGAVSNVPLSSAMFKEFHSLILSTLEINGGQVKIRDTLNCYLTIGIFQ